MSQIGVFFDHVQNLDSRLNSCVFVSIFNNASSYTLRKGVGREIKVGK